MHRRWLFWLFYKSGKAPWEGHALPKALIDYVEGPAALPRARALDSGCGTGDASIYMAKHGWDVTAYDWVEIALGRARKKADKAGVNVRFLRADAAKFTSEGVEGRFNLILDSGLMHGLDVAQRDAYVIELTKAAAPGATLILCGFADNPNRRGPRGYDQAEIQRRFANGWQFVSGGKDDNVSNDPNDPILVYELRRT